MNPAETVIISNCPFNGSGDAGSIISVNGGPKSVEQILQERPQGNGFIIGPNNRCCSCSIAAKTLTQTKNGDESFPGLRQYMGNSHERWGIHGVILPSDNSIGVTITQADGTRCSTDRSREALQCGIGTKDHPNVSKVTVQKVCSHPKWRWDPDCTSNTKTSIVYPESDNGEQIRRNQGTDCWSFSANYEIGSNCRTFCSRSDNISDCATYVKSYCTKQLQNGQSIKNELCNPHLDEVYSQSCKANNMHLPECQDYCNRDDKWEQCKGDVFRYCQPDKIKTDTWCQKVLASTKAHGENNAVMSQFCNGEGADMPLCSCLNLARIKKDVESIKDVEPNTVSSFMSRPDCFYQACSVGATYRMVKNPPGCQPKKKKKNIIGVLHVGNNSMIKQDNNCNQTVNQGGTPKPTTEQKGPTATNPENESKNEPKNEPKNPSKSSKALLGLGVGAFTLFMVFSCICFCCCCLVLLMTRRR